MSDWPIPKVENGEYIVTMGFPGAWRQARGTECKFVGIGIPLAVTDTSDLSIASFCDEENQDVLSDMKDSLAGISGSPAYPLTDYGELRLVGFAKLGPEGSETPERRYCAQAGSPLCAAVFFAHASFLQQDGTLLSSDTSERCR